MPARPIAISLSPNTEPDDIKEAGSTLLKPHNWKNADLVDKAEKQISQLLNGRYTAMASSGRRALFDLLRAYNIGSGHEVIIQAFTCIAVPAPIIWTGAKPIYADIIPETFNMDPEDLEKKITQKTRAVIIQHTFGIPADIERIKNIASKHNLILIEDCAHALGGTYKNQLLGTFGDVAMLSFGRDKQLSCVFGGAVVSENKDLIDKIKEYQTKLPYPPSLWTARQLFHPIAFSVILPLYFKASLGKVMLVALQKIFCLGKAVEKIEKTGGKPSHFNYRFSPALANLLINQLNKLNRYTNRRRAIANRYRNELGDLIITPDSNPAWLRFPMNIRNRDEVLRKAQKSHMLLGDWYHSPLAPPDSSLDKFNYIQGSCPKAESVTKTIINLPTYPLLTDDQVGAVISLIKNTRK